MTNEEWIKGLNPSQIKRRIKSGKIPTFAIYKIYNHVKKEWQFINIVSDNPSRVWYKLFNEIGNDARKWRFEVEMFRNFNPFTLEWEKPKRREEGIIKHYDSILMETVELKCKEWLRKEHMES